ncbi:DUF1367 family protein [Rhodobacter sp. NTK016B]|uniref:DUF1367 family protein n=1 Tax=Rhodobacter sp. NTK016B TaxID=2759676 RepID=UPI001A8D6D43|nr:DUF1367 family protein [Rhodobacter sp. NTK016B]MBN8292860.1 DUF1367 family protein [Rhodobacter sp. NTK016B]
MPTIWGQRRGSVFVPYQKFGAAFEEIPEGARLKVKIDRDRNGKFSALFHVALGLLVAAINRGPASTSIDALKQWVKLKKGWYDVVELPHPAPDGQTHAIAYRSTSFATMGEAEFHAFCTDACELIRAELAPWVSSAPEWAEVRAIIDSIAPEEA